LKITGSKPFADKFCVIDIGSTTTKAILFKRESDWRYIRQEAPTSVEKPYEDVTYGVTQALMQLEIDTGDKLLENGKPCIPCLATSSAGGGLAIAVAGLVKAVTSTSAERVALGAGSIILDIISLDDGRTPYRKIETLKKLRPDLFLLAGGFDGGAIFGPVFLAELLNQSGLVPKLSQSSKLPVIYAGNTDARELVESTISEKFSFHSVPNLRPSSYSENLEPARTAIHDIFMDHVMSHAPGYEKFKSWTDSQIIPTPSAFSKILSLISKDLKARILAVDIGGATTDVFTAENGKLFRTVSANLGMSYSIINVVEKAGLDAISEMLDTDLSGQELLNRIGNKFLNPTRLADNLIDTKIECAVASAAIRLAVRDHFEVKNGISMSRGKEDLSWNKLKSQSGNNLNLDYSRFLANYDIIIGSGGRLSHSPRDTSAMILVNALKPEGCIDLALDNEFMFPQLGALSQVDPDLACELFYKFGFIKLGKLIAPTGKARNGDKVLSVEGINQADLKEKTSFEFNQMKLVPIKTIDEQKIKLKVKKLKLKQKKIIVDSSDNKLIIDTRGKPASKAASYLIPDDFKPSQRTIISAIENKIYKGDISIRRELVIPGQVYVQKGDKVKSATIIAKSTRSFLRPFFLNVADALNITGEQMMKILVKSEGDEIQTGDILATNENSVFHQKVYRSAVNGTIEKILSAGIVVVREKEEHSGQLSTVRIAEDLRIAPEKIGGYLKCEIGQEIEKDQVLAVMPASIPRMSRSPMRGKIKEINLEYGSVIIESLLEELELNAWVPGIVEDVSDKGCSIANQGAIITGAWGSGGEKFGKLVINNYVKGSIAVFDSVDSKTMKQLVENDIGGLITGSLNLIDFSDLNPEFPIVMIEEFGTSKLSNEIYKLLEDQAGKLVMIDGTTQLRVGVKRPTVVLPEKF